MYRLGPRSLPGGLTLDGGSDWVCLSKDLIHYILSSQKDELLQGLDSIFEYTLLPGTYCYWFMAFNWRDWLAFLRLLISIFS